MNGMLEILDTFLQTPFCSLVPEVTPLEIKLISLNMAGLRINLSGAGAKQLTGWRKSPCHRLGV